MQGNARAHCHDLIEVEKSSTCFHLIHVIKSAKSPDRPYSLFPIHYSLLPLPSSLLPLPLKVRYIVLEQHRIARFYVARQPLFGRV
jgi:hypothetical protein